MGNIEYMRVCVYTHTYEYMYVCVYTYIHTYVYKQTLSSRESLVLFKKESHRLIVTVYLVIILLD